MSIVVPVYGCRDCLRELHRRLANAVATIAKDVEFIYVDDRDRDGSWQVLCELAAADVRVSAFRLSRNFGQHAAITAGLSRAAGKWIVVMDCDLQDPPEEVPRLYAKALEGYDIVFASRRGRSDALPRRAMSPSTGSRRSSA